MDKEQQESYEANLINTFVILRSNQGNYFLEKECVQEVYMCLNDFAIKYLVAGRMVK